MSKIRDAAALSSRRQFVDAQRAWADLRKGGDLGIVADLLLIELSARVGDLDTVEGLRAQYMPLAEHSRELTEAFRVASVLAERRANLPASKPEDPVLKRELGRKLLEARCLEDAFRLWSSLKDEFPKEAEPPKRLAQVCEWRGDWERVIEFATASLQIREDADLTKILAGGQAMSRRAEEPPKELARRFLAHPLMQFAASLAAEGGPMAPLLEADLSTMQAAILDRPPPQVSPAEETQTGAGSTTIPSDHVYGGTDASGPISQLNGALASLAEDDVEAWVVEEAIVAIRCGEFKIAGEIVQMLERNRQAGSSGE